MHPQLQLVADEYRSAQARLHDLVRAVPDEQWGKRSDPARWSVVECVAHLNITDRKSTRLNSSHSQISYAVFCLKKKKNISMSSSPQHSARAHARQRRRTLRTRQMSPRTLCAPTTG